MAVHDNYHTQFVDKSIFMFVLITLFFEFFINLQIGEFRIQSLLQTINSPKL